MWNWRLIAFIHGAGGRNDTLIRNSAKETIVPRISYENIVFDQSRQSNGVYLRTRGAGSSLVICESS